MADEAAREAGRQLLAEKRAARDQLEIEMDELRQTIAPPPPPVDEAKQRRDRLCGTAGIIIWCCLAVIGITLQIIDLYVVNQTKCRPWLPSLAEFLEESKNIPNSSTRPWCDGTLVVIADIALVIPVLTVFAAAAR